MCDKLHLDIIGPVPTASGYRYYVTIVDRFTRWSEALPVMDICAETIKGVSRTISIDRLKLFFADRDPSKPTLVDKSSNTSTSASTVSAASHHSQQSTSEKSSKLRVRFTAQYVTRFGRAAHPSKGFL
ncbi:hypothetical protein TNCV_3878671 [Trichonephila clavipes]|nr:hypothetical protein TNCV_3878671 [Trichonephila clavipes]